MISFRYAALTLLVTAAAPAMAQDLSAVSVVPLPAEYGTSVASVFESDMIAPVDSILFDDPTNTFQFIFGVDFPGGAATPQDPGEARAGRTTYYATFTNTRATPFVVTGVRATYRTSAVTAATSTPPRVQYDGEPPVMAVFLGNTAPEPDDDSLSAPGSIFQRELPLITRTVPSTVDMYPLPQFGNPTISVVAPGATAVDPRFVLAPGASIAFRFQHFNVPRALAYKAGASAAANGTHFILQPTGYLTNNSLTYTPGAPDAAPADAFDDLFGIVRLLSDNAFFPTAGEDGVAASGVALGRPSPNPAQGMVDLPFALLQDGRARIAVYDVTGRQVAVVADRTFGSGGQVAEFDASRLAAGVYVVVLEANGERAVQRLSVVR